MTSLLGNFLSNPVFKTRAFQYIHEGRQPFQERDQNVYQGESSQGAKQAGTKAAGHVNQLSRDDENRQIQHQKPNGPVVKLDPMIKQTRPNVQGLVKNTKAQNARYPFGMVKQNNVNFESTKDKKSRFNVTKYTQPIEKPSMENHPSNDYYMIDYFTLDDYDANDADSSMLTASPDTTVEILLEEDISDIIGETRESVKEKDYEKELYYEIIACMKRNEHLYVPRADYFTVNQTHLRPRIRAILNDWFVEVGIEFELTIDSIFMATNYLDRLLVELTSVRKSELQSYGIACLVLGAKMDDRKAPLISDYSDITDNNITEEQIIEVEERVVNLLEFDLVVDSIPAFTRMYLKGELDQNVSKLVEYFACLSLLDYKFMREKPSKMAAACISIARYTLGYPIWSNEFGQLCCYMPQEIIGLVESLYEVHKKMYNKGFKLDNISKLFSMRENLFIAQQRPKAFAPSIIDFENIM